MHAHSSMSSATAALTDNDFKSAARYISQQRRIKVATAHQLKLYGLYKQASFGDNTAPKPSLLDYSGRHKWQAWQDVKGVGSEQCKQQYLELVDALIPHWRSKAAESNAKVEQLQKASSESKQQHYGNEDFLDSSDDEGDTWSTPSGQLVSSVGGMALADVEELKQDHAPTKVDGITSITNDLFHYAVTGDIAGFDGCMALQLQHNDVTRDKTHPINAVDETQRTPLHYASDRGQTKLVEHILTKYKSDVNLNQQDSDGMTALHYACLCEHIEVGKLLIQAGADTTIADASGELALDGEMNNKLRSGQSLDHFVVR